MENLANITAGDQFIKDLTKEDYLKLLYFMTLSRGCDEKMVSLYKQGKIYGGAFSSQGNEATTVGTAYPLGPGDSLLPLHRQLGAFLVRGKTPRDFFCNYFGRDESWTKGRDCNVHTGHVPLKIYGMISHLGAMTSVAVGLGYASLYQNSKRVALNYIGDGATNTGAFHEALNFIAVRKLPVVVVIDNNQYSYSTPNDQSFACHTLADRGPGYGLEAMRLDGMDILKVYQASKYAVDKARNGGGPTLLECVTLRMRGHAEHDDARYVPKEMLEEYRLRDPLVHFPKFLLSKKIVTQLEIDEIKQRVREEIEAGVAYAEARPLPDPQLAYGPVYAK